MPYGYNGKILHVDLSNQQIKVEEPDEAFYRYKKRLHGYCA